MLLCCYCLLFFNESLPPICLFSDMAECKVLKFSSHPAQREPRPSYQPHNSHHQAAQLHQRPRSASQESIQQAAEAASSTNNNSNKINTTCLPQSHPNVNHNNPPGHQQEQQHTVCSNQSVSIAVVLVIIMSLVVIKTASSQCAQRLSHLSISSQRQRLI